jgi:hypothetical protein
MGASSSSKSEAAILPLEKGEGAERSEADGVTLYLYIDGPASAVKG